MRRLFLRPVLLIWSTSWSDADHSNFPQEFTLIMISGVYSPPQADNTLALEKRMIIDRQEHKPKESPTALLPTHQLCYVRCLIMFTLHSRKNRKPSPTTVLQIWSCLNPAAPHLQAKLRQRRQITQSLKCWSGSILHVSVLHDCFSYKLEHISGGCK